MSAYAEQQTDFRRFLATTGIRSPEKLSGDWRNLLPDHIQRAWINRFWRPHHSPQELVDQYLNHFMVGADPEFWFYHPQDGRIDANVLGLKAGLAWGADNNGRLAELRPVPSRSTLTVVASIGAELSWMCRLNANLTGYQWKSGAHNGQDGLGGHVHFGRKSRRQQPQEIAALDTLAFWLYHAGIFDLNAGRERFRRTRQHGDYGKPGDVRKQAHGWEYRTLPSWIDSPWLAFFVLTLSKLVVCDPALIPALQPALEAESASSVRSRLAALLAYYQHRDADAALAYAVLARYDFPKWDNTDFRPRWGIYNPPAIRLQVDITPDAVAPSLEEIREMASALLERRAPEPVTFTPTWKPFALPEGYEYLPNIVQTRHAPGLGELVVGLATVKNDLQISALQDRANAVYIGKNFHRNWAGPYWKELHLRVPEVKFYASTDDITIQFTTGLDYRRHARALREFLLGGDFPIWRVEDVNPTIYTVWRTMQAGRKVAAPATKKSNDRFSHQL